jgi:YVTN family beta-propeller protein
MRIVPALCCICLAIWALPRLGETARVRAASTGSLLLPTGQVVRPAGDKIAFSGRPVDLALAPDAKTLYVKDNRGLVVIDAHAWKRRQELAFEKGGGSLHGIAVSEDGAHVYATNSDNLLCEAILQPDGSIAWGRKIVLPGPGGKGPSYPCGIALSADGNTAFVALSRNNTVGIVDMEAGRLRGEIPVGVAPWGVAISADGHTVFVSNWGGRRPKPGERTAPSSGTPTLVDARGVASSGSVSCVDVVKEVETAQIETGLHPSDIVLRADGERLYVANANSDTVSVVDVHARRVRETISVHPDKALPFGSAPNALALSHDGKTLYVANGGNNAVVVIDLEGERPKTRRILGMIPTGWYPGALAIDADSLYIANVKGLGSRSSAVERVAPEAADIAKKRSVPPAHSGYSVYDYLGTVDRVSLPDAAQLTDDTAQVRADARLTPILRERQRAASDRSPAPVPTHLGEPSSFEHIVYVIKENRTYDQVFGDLKQANGDPKLCLFGREVTPNHHALAEQFVLLDNFYCNGVVSADGHSWVTEGNVTDHLEKAFGGFTRSYTFGDDPLTYSSSGFLWDNALAHGLSVRNYGEMDYAEPVPSADFFAIYRDYLAKTGKYRFKQSIGVERLRRLSSPDYPGWNLKIPDVLRADRFLKELHAYEAKGDWPSLSLVYLPQDHTSGTAPGGPSPRAQVADNDLALGRVVEGITQSRFWPTACIFVVEDDPQNGFDHVDGHRSLCLVVSPYTRRGAVLHQFYNQTAVIHTLERMLGLPAMNQMDAAAPLMGDCFTAMPDTRPYACLPNRIPLDERNPPVDALHGPARTWAGKSLAMDFKRPDAADEETLNRMLWYSVRGAVPYPAHLAGAHGKGLKAFGLRPAE